MNKNKLVLIIDMQNDFCAKVKTNASINSIKKATKGVHFAIKKAREGKYKIAFTRSLQIFNKLPQNIKDRIEKNGKKINYLVPTSWGADFFQIQPKKDEAVITKYRYDAFTNPRFEKYLKKNKIKEIIFCGFFLDICVDSTMRSAYQKGFYITLLKDATVPLYYEKKIVENFMKKFYNAKIKTVKNYF
ncbi:MAG: isochorismatase family cysteine hydrolase [Patescibacteria group bacterium]